MSRALGEEITGFAYPYAFPQQDRQFTETFGRLLRRVGYQTSVTTMIGRAAPGDDWFCLKRLPVNDGDDLDLFTAKLHGAYDWLAYPQGWYKSVRHQLGRTGRKKSNTGTMPPAAVRKVSL